MTRPQPDDRNPRLPAVRNFGFRAADPSEEESTCKAEALREAFKSFFSSTSAGLLVDSARVDDGGVRKPKPADTRILRTSFFTQSGFDPKLVENVPREFTEAFDYRRFLLIAISTGTFLKGRLVCFGLVGASTVPPEDRGPRWPAKFQTVVRELPVGEGETPGSADRCESDALNRSLALLLDQPWDESGLLKNLKATREDGVTPVRGIKKKAEPSAASALEAPRNTGGPAFKAQGTSVTNLHYECFNGDCVRIYPSGKRERFQAPRCFDPFKQTREWKPEGC